MNGTDALTLIFERNAFYKRMHFLVLAAFILNLIVIISLSIVIILLSRNPTKPLYFATDRVGRLIKIIPLNRPNMSTDDVAAWTINAVQSAFSYDYINYRSELQTTQKYFTEYGWSKYMQSLRSSNNLLALTQRRWVIIAQAVNKPQLITQGLLRSGVYAWKFQLSLLVTYWEPPYDAKSKFVNALQVSVIVQRQPILQSNKGLGIVQMIASFAESNQPQQLSNVPPSA